MVVVVEIDAVVIVSYSGCGYGQLADNDHLCCLAWWLGRGVVEIVIVEVVEGGKSSESNMDELTKSVDGSSLVVRAELRMVDPVLLVNKPIRFRPKGTTQVKSRLHQSRRA